MEEELYYDELKGEFQMSHQTKLKCEEKYSSMQGHSSVIDLLHQLIYSESSGAIQIAWTIFIKELEEEMNDLHLKIKHLEKNIKFKTKQIEENTLAFEELQTELNRESDKLLVQDRAKYTKIIIDLKASLAEKDREFEEQMEFKKEFVEKLNAVFRQKKRSKVKKAELLREREDMVQEIELQKDVINHLKRALDETKDELDKEKMVSYKKGVEKGRQLAYDEEIQIFKQLEILQNIQLILERDAKQKQVEIFEDD